MVKRPEMWRHINSFIHTVMRKKPVVALIYDFDGTLSPGNMQEFGFIQAIGKSPKEFWTESDNIALGQDASNILSYMKLMFDEARKADIKLCREDFRRFGASVELFKGVKEWFSLVNAYGKVRGVRVEHYINSSGLAEMIEGTDFVIASVTTLTSSITLLRVSPEWKFSFPFHRLSIRRVKRA